MRTYMILDSEPLTRDQIDAAIARAHTVRSEAAWGVCAKIGSKISKLFHSNVAGESGLAHSS